MPAIFVEIIFHLDYYGHTNFNMNAICNETARVISFSCMTIVNGINIGNQCIILNMVMIVL